MRPEDVLRVAPKILTSEQRERYFRAGYLAAEGLIPDAWISRVRAAARSASLREASAPGRS